MSIFCVEIYLFIVSSKQGMNSSIQDSVGFSVVSIAD